MVNQISCIAMRRFACITLLSFGLTALSWAQGLQLVLSDSSTTNRGGAIDVTLTATISPWKSGYSGTLTFTDNGLTFQQVDVPTGSNGTFSITIPNIYPGLHNFSAAYQGVHDAHPSGVLSDTFGVPIVAVPPEGSAYLGAWAKDPKNFGPPTPPGIGTLESDIGRHVAIHLEYVGWTNDPSMLWTDPLGLGSALADDFNHNRVPLVSWKCSQQDSTGHVLSTVADMANGSEDTYIDAIAQGLATIAGQPGQNKVMLRWCWEMNLPGTAKSYSATTESGQQAEFINGWRHLVHRLRTDFANPNLNPNNNPRNVIFVFNPGTYLNDPAGHPVGNQYYPGGEYVDWIGLDKYNDNSTNTNFANTPGIVSINPNDHQGFYPIYTNTAAASLPVYPAIGYDKPLLIGETGARFCGPASSCVPSNTDVQANYIATAASEIPAKYPQIKSFFYFSSSGAVGDWELDGDLTSGGGLLQFKNMACSKAFLYPHYTCP